MVRARAMAGLLLAGLLVGAALAGAALTGGIPTLHVTEERNATHHINPATLQTPADSGELTVMARYLVGRLGNSTIQLSQGQYQRAESLLGGEFTAQVDHLVDVAGQTPSETDDRLANRVQATKQRQARYLTLLETFRDTVDAFRAAQQAGNTTRARRLARRLSTIAAHLRTLGQDLRTNYAVLGNLTNTSYQQSRHRIANVTTNITTQLHAIQATVFVDTRLTVSTATANISFIDPLTLTGRLTTVTGNPVANRTIHLQVGPQPRTTTTNATGWFTIQYRPTTIPASTQSLRIRYHPRNTSQYLGTNTTVNVSVTRITPTITVQSVPATVGFGDTMTITGRVSARTVGAGTVPVVVTIGDYRLGTTTTNTTGHFTITTAVPADVPPGTQPVKLQFPLSTAALSSTNTSTPVTVVRRETTVTVTATPTQETTVRVQGHLTGPTGTPVANQSLTVTLANTTVTVLTNSQGRYRTTISVPGLAPGTDRRVTLTVRFTGDDTNLAPSRATTTLTVSRPEQPTPSPDEEPTDLIGRLLAGDLPPWAWASIGLAAIAIIAGLGHLLRYPTPSQPRPETDISTGNGHQTPDADALLDQAKSELARGTPETAVRTAYAAVRASIAPTHGPVLTPWELVAQQPTPLDSDHRQTLATITQTYERAVYAPDPVSDSEAATTIDQVTTLLEELRQ